MQESQGRAASLPLRPPRAEGAAAVFISHAGTEKADVVSHLEKELKRRRINVFVDYEMKIGTHAPPKMLETARSVLVGVAVLSVDYFKRKWPTDELAIFLERKRADPSAIEIVPYFYSVKPNEKRAKIVGTLNVKQRGLLNQISKFTGVEQREGDRDADNIEKLADHIEGLLPPGRRRKTDDEERLWDGYSILPNDFLQAPSHLLRAGSAVVPFSGRTATDALESLETWARDTSKTVSARVVHAPGGAGKTRLALQLCEQLRAVGFVAGFSPAPFDAAVVERLARARWPAVIVLDYAESRVDLGTFLTPIATLLANRAPAHFRLLLLSRTAGDWLTVLKTSNHEIGSLLGEYQPLELPGTASSGVDREQHFQRALFAFAKHLGQPPRQIVPPPLNDPRYSRILYIHMAALATQLGLPVAADTLLDEIVLHEERGWVPKLNERFSTRLGLSDEALQSKMRLLVAAITLRGGMDNVTTLEKVVENVWIRLPGELIEAVCLMLREFYPGRTARAVLPLEPDLLGETLVYRAMKAENPDRVLVLIVRLFEDNDKAALMSAFSMFARMSADRNGIEPWIKAALEMNIPERAPIAVQAILSLVTSDNANARMMGVYTRLGQALAHSLEQSDSLQLASRIMGMLPQKTVALQEVALWAVTLQTASMRASVDVSAENVGDVLAFIKLLFRKTQIERQLGHVENALQSAQESLLRVRNLVEGEPGKYQELLATCMTNLGNAQSATGQREAALKSAHDSVDIYRNLALARPDTFLPDLALSLTNLSIMQSALGQPEREAALQSAQESVDIRRKLVVQRADTFLPDLASSLANLSNGQSKLGQREAALQSAQESVDILRKLALARPDAVLPDLASSLTNLGNRQSKLGQREAALQAAQESVDIRRNLALVRPDAFLPDLALSLTNLGIMQSALGQREAALKSAQESVDICRKLALARPDAFLPDLALSLTNLGNWQSALGQHEAALKLAQESVDIHRRLAQARSDSFLPDLESSLANLGNMQSALGQLEAALQSAQESVDICRKLALARPDAFLPDLALSLTNLGNRQSALGHREAALKSAQESVDIHRRLVLAWPDTFLPNLASSLTNLGSTQIALDQRETALQSAQESVDICRKLALARPDAFLPNLALSLTNLGNRQSALGEREVALESAQESVEIYRKLALARFDAFSPNLAASLSNLGDIQFLSQRYADARDSANESIQLYRQLSTARSSVLKPKLSDPLCVLGQALAELGDHDSAVAAFVEAIEIVAPLAVEQPGVYRGKYSQAVNQLADIIQRPAATAAALPSAEFVVRHLRYLASIIPSEFARQLSSCLLFLADCGEMAGQLEKAAGSRQEAMSLLADAGPSLSA